MYNLYKDNKDSVTSDGLTQINKQDCEEFNV